jgi:hypothetical protein
MVYLFLKQENPWVGEMRIPALKSFLKYGCTRLSKFRYRQIAKLLKEEPNEKLPASILKNHPNVTIYCDESAASLID